MFPFLMFRKIMKLIAGGLDFGYDNFAAFCGCFSASDWKFHKMGVNVLTWSCAINVQMQKRQLHWLFTLFL